MSSDLIPVYFRPIIESETEDTAHDIAEALEVPAVLAKIIYPYMSSPPPKIQFWNDYPGRATLRSWDHKIYMLGANGPVGPLGITDERGSYSLSRKLIGPARKTIDLFASSFELNSTVSWMGICETLILTELKDGKVTVQEVAEHEDCEDYHFNHKIYEEKQLRSRLEEFSPGFQCCLDYTRAKHRRILSGESKSPTLLKDQKGNFVEDAEIVVAANWYVLTLTRSGDLYFNQDLYMENVQSIATASTNDFVLILNENHAHEFHRNMRLRTYLRDRNAYNGKEIEELKSIGRNFGLRDSSRRVVGPSVYIRNYLGYICLRTDGRIECNSPISLELYYTCLADSSNHVKIVVASRYHFAALLQLGNGSQEVYVWGEEPAISEKLDFGMHRCFVKETPDGKAERKRIVNIMVSDNVYDAADNSNYFMSQRKRIRHKIAVALHFEDNTSCLLSLSENLHLSRILPPFLLIPPLPPILSVLTSFHEHIRSIYTTVDGMLVVTDSRILKITEPGRVPDIVADSDRRYVSFVASSDGYVIVYPDGKYDASESVQPPADIQDMIRRGGGIAEIHHDRSGTFHAILRDGRIASWYSETSVVFRNTPKWNMDKSLIRRPN